MAVSLCTILCIAYRSVWCIQIVSRPVLLFLHFISWPEVVFVLFSPRERTVCSQASFHSIRQPCSVSICARLVGFLQCVALSTRRRCRDSCSDEPAIFSLVNRSSHCVVAFGMVPRLHGIAVSESLRVGVWLLSKGHGCCLPNVCQWLCSRQWLYEQCSRMDYNVAECFPFQTIHTERQAGDECREHEVRRWVCGCRPPVPHLPPVAIWKPHLKLPGVIDYRNITW